MIHGSECYICIVPTTTPVNPGGKTYWETSVNYEYVCLFILLIPLCSWSFLIHFSYVDHVFF